MMSLSDLKTLFRKYIKVVAGGPVDKTRGAGMLTVLDALAEQLFAGGVSLAYTRDTARADRNTGKLPPGRPTAAVAGTWNGVADLTVYMQVLEPDAFANFGLLVNGLGQLELRKIDLDAGTAVLLGANEVDFSSVTIDAYTKQQADNRFGALTIQQLHTQQLQTLGAQGAPAMAYLASGDTVGFATLDAALADHRQKTFMRFNQGTVTVTTSNALDGAGWPFYLDASGTSVFINDNVVLSVSGNSADTLIIANLFAYFPAYAATGTGFINLLDSGRGGVPSSARAAQLLDGYSVVPLRLNGGTLTLTNGYYASLLGTGTVYLYGTVQVDQVASGLTLIDHRAPELPRPAAGTTVTFEKERHWPVISSGTYTVDATGAVADVCFQLVLEPGCTEITIPTTGFIKVNSGLFDGTVENTYWFCVRVDGAVQYAITQRH